MQKEKWNYKGKEIEIPIVSDADIERNIVINLEDTQELSRQIINDRLEDTMELNLEDTQEIPATGEDYYE